MRCCIGLSLVLLLGASIALGQTVEYIETVDSPVQMFQSNVGITAFDLARQKGGLIWPRGSDNQFIFAMGLWIGGQVLVGDNMYRKLVATTYNPHTGTGWCGPRSVVETDDDVSRHAMIYTSSFDDSNLDRYDNPSKREAEGYPLGLDFQQRLTVFSDGPFKDVAILHTTVRNNHPTRDVYNFIIGTVLDMDIGKASAPQLASQRDRSEIVNGTNQAGIFKFWDDSVSTMWNPGVMGVAFVDEPAWDAMSSAQVQTYTDFTYQENADRYDAMATQSWGAWPAPSDLIALFGKRLVGEFPVGASVHSTMVLMFGAGNTVENDQAMISMVETLRATVGVNDNTHTTSQSSIFPNPVTASHVYLLSDRDVDRLEVYTAVGQLVKSITNPTSTINIDDLLAGQYHIVLYSGREVNRHRLVVLR